MGHSRCAKSTFVNIFHFQSQLELNMVKLINHLPLDFNEEYWNFSGGKSQHLHDLNIDSLTSNINVLTEIIFDIFSLYCLTERLLIEQLNIQNEMRK